MTHTLEIEDQRVITVLRSLPSKYINRKAFKFIPPRTVRAELPEWRAVRASLLKINTEEMDPRLPASAYEVVATVIDYRIQSLVNRSYF